jgi:hypothetical protein
VVDHGGANLVGMSVRHHDISLSNLLKKNTFSNLEPLSVKYHISLRDIATKHNPTI